MERSVRLQDGIRLCLNDRARLILKSENSLTGMKDVAEQWSCQILNEQSEFRKWRCFSIKGFSLNFLSKPESSQWISKMLISSDRHNECSVASFMPLVTFRIQEPASLDHSRAIIFSNTVLFYTILISTLWIFENLKFTANQVSHSFAGLNRYCGIQSVSIRQSL